MIRAHFRRISRKSGNRTLRVVATDGQQRVPQELLDELVALGCGYPGATPRYVCINIPHEVSLEAAMAVFEESDLDREHADPTHEQLHPKRTGDPHG